MPVPKFHGTGVFVETLATDFSSHPRPSMRPTLILLALPIAQTIMWRAPTANEGQGFPVRIMTYNLHNGFNTKGKLNMEEIAQVIERNNPDVVALQEVSRGCEAY